MSVPATVVVNAAGRGVRLGMGISKALVSIHGRTLIEWQMALIPAESEVVVGVGYQASEVARAALSARPDISVVYNPDFDRTGTASTLLRGARLARGRVVSLDADLIVNPEDLHSFVYEQQDTIGVGPIESDEPVLVAVHSRKGIMYADAFEPNAMHVGPQHYEWTGLLNFDPKNASLGPQSGHVFQLATPLLPIAVRQVRSRELDVPEELIRMQQWLLEIGSL